MPKKEYMANKRKFIVVDLTCPAPATGGPRAPWYDRQRCGGKLEELPQAEREVTASHTKP